MKLSIRQNVFETNSSSVHAIVIDTSGETERQALMYYDGPELGDYGRSTKFLTDAEARLSYLWTAIWDLKTNYTNAVSKDNSLYEEKFKKADELPDMNWWKDRLYNAWSPALKYNDYEPSFQEVSGFGDYDNWVNVGIDHCLSIIPFLERLQTDDQLLHDYIFGNCSYVLVTNNEGGVLTDVPKIADHEIVMKAIDDENRDFTWNRFHEYPDQDRVIYIKEE